MSLLDKASLFVTPNGYKASKLYSIIPSNGAGDLDVTRATTATRVNANGLIESVANNVTRLDYLNGDCPTILLEPQRTNVQTYSEDFSNAVYIKVGASVSTDVVVAPDGTTTGDKLIEDTSNGYHTADIFQPPVGAGDYTISVFVKAAERTKFQIQGFFALTGNVTFDLTAGTATTTAPAKNGKIENYGNGWFRCQATFADLTGAGAQILLNILNDSGQNNYIGNGTSGLYLWGAQLEPIYASSYIKTQATAITRNAEVINKSAITSLIGQTEGTMFIDTYIDNISSQINNPVLFYVRGISVAFIQVTSTGVIYAGYNDGTSFTCLIEAVVGLQNGRHKFAFAYKNNDFILYLDGNQIGTDTSGLVSGTLTSFGFQYDVSGFDGEQNVNASGLWKTRLTNSELAELTTI